MEWWTSELEGNFESGIDFTKEAERRTKWERELGGDWRALEVVGKAEVGDGYGSASDDELGIIGADTVNMAPIEWLWRYRFARGEMASWRAMAAWASHRS